MSDTKEHDEPAEHKDRKEEQTVAESDPVNAPPAPAAASADPSAAAESVAGSAAPSTAAPTSVSTPSPPPQRIVYGIVPGDESASVAGAAPGKHARAASLADRSAGAAQAAANPAIKRAASVSVVGAAGAAALSSPRADGGGQGAGGKPSFRQALQIIRAQDLEQEAALLAHSAGAEDSFFLKQEERFNLCLKRAQMAAASARDLHHYLKKSSKLLSGISEALGGLGSFGVSGETGSMRVACMSIDIVRKSTGSYLSELNARVFSESLQRAAESAEAAAALLSNMESAGTDALKQLKSQRKATHDAWQNYVLQAQERHTMELRGQPLKSDPYLLCCAYELELYAQRTAETKFQQLMSSLLRDLEAQDAKRLANMKATLLDNLQAQKAVLEHSVKFTENALITVRAINPQQDVQEFTTAADLYLPPSPMASANSNADAAAASVAAAGGAQTSADATALSAHAQTGKAADALASATPIIAFLAPPPARDPNALARVYAHEIEKEGSLSRQGSVFKSNWKSCHAVVTASGFLHLFDDRSKKQVHSSISLADCVVEHGESVHPLALQITVAAKKGGLFSSPTVLYFKADNADEQQEWQILMQKHSQAQINNAPAAAGSPKNA